MLDNASYFICGRNLWLRLMQNIKQKTFHWRIKILTGSNILSTINKTGVAFGEIFSDFATAMALGITFGKYDY